MSAVIRDNSPGAPAPRRKQPGRQRLFFTHLMYEVRWRAFPYFRRLYDVGAETNISTRAIVRDPRLIRLGCCVRIGHGAELWTFSHHPSGSPHSIVCGDETDIRPYALLHAYGGFIQIGNRSCINSFCFVNGSGGVTIGDDVMMGTNTVVLSSEHGTADVPLPMSLQPCIDRPVVIENNVYIGAGVTILAGVRIQTGAVIGSGAVVRQDVPPKAIVAGVPARLIRYRGVESEPAGETIDNRR